MSGSSEEHYTLTPGMTLFLDYAEKNGWAVLMNRWYSAYKKEWVTSYAVRHNGISVAVENDSDCELSYEAASEIIRQTRRIAGDY